jgi:hypothetical protein
MQRLLPTYERPTEVSTLKWSEFHEQAFKDLIKVACKINMSPNKLNQLSYLLNFDDLYVTPLFGINKELLFNDGELAKLLLVIGKNVPLKDFNSYLSIVSRLKETTMMEHDAKEWIVPSTKGYIKQILNTFPESQRDFYENLSSKEFFGELSSNSLLGDKAEIWYVLEHFKNNSSLRSKSAVSSSESLKSELVTGGSKSVPGTPVSCDGDVNKMFLKLLYSQPKLFNNNLELFRRLTGLDESNFEYHLGIFRRGLTEIESIAAMDFIVGNTNKNSGELYALVNDLGRTTPLYNKQPLRTWGELKLNFEPMLSSLLKTTNGLVSLDPFRLAASRKATEIFDLRFTDGLVDEIDARWWGDFNQLCIDLKFLNALKLEWNSLSEKQIEILSPLPLTKDLTLHTFMTHELPVIKSVLESSLKRLCFNAPIDEEYLSDNWCCSDYGVLLSNHNISVTNRLDLVNELKSVFDTASKMVGGKPHEKEEAKNHLLNHLVTKENAMKLAKKGFKSFKVMKKEFEGELLK